MTLKERRVMVARAIRAVQGMTKNDDISSSISALVLTMLPHVPELSEVRKQLQSRLIAILTPEYIRTKDLLELFTVLYALSKEGVAQNGKQMACIAKRLLAAEQEVGGPYQSEDDRMDLLTNAYIGAFIREIAEPLPRLEAYLRTHISQYDFRHSAYTPQATAYMLLQTYPNSMVRDFLCIEKQGVSPQNTAFDLLSGAAGDSDAVIEYLSTSQLSNGSWLAEEFIKGQPSTLLTTTLIVRSLTKDTSAKKQLSPGRNLEKELHSDIICQAFQVYNQTADPLKTSGHGSIEEIVQADKQHEITLLPFYFAQALGLAMDDKAIERYRLLGLANVLCWTAYTIYDNLLDNEGDPQYLSVANVAQRAAIGVYGQALGEKDEFLSYIADGFLGMDEANAWEFQHCRYTQQQENIFITTLPDFGELDMLASRSFGHVFGPLALVYSDQIAVTTYQKKVVESALRHYLIARQLNDDIHDWQADIKRGQVSYVVASILQELAIPPGSYNMERLLRAMRLCFWSRILPKLGRRILQHTDQARLLLKDSKLILNRGSIWPFIDKIEASARAALDTQADSQEFLFAYQDSNMPVIRSNT